MQWHQLHIRCLLGGVSGTAIEMDGNLYALWENSFHTWRDIVLCCIEVYNYHLFEISRVCLESWSRSLSRQKLPDSTVLNLTQRNSTHHTM